MSNSVPCPKAAGRDGSGSGTETIWEGPARRGGGLPSLLAADTQARGPPRGKMDAWHVDAAEGSCVSCSALQTSSASSAPAESVSTFSRHGAGPAPDAKVAPLFWELPAQAFCQFSLLIVSLTYRILKNKPSLRIPCTFYARQIFLSG